MFSLSVRKGIARGKFLRKQEIVFGSVMISTTAQPPTKTPSDER